MSVFLASRKVRIRKNGGMQFSIPKSFLINIKAEQGQELQMFLDDKNQSLIVRKV
jgi:antitoxin component of MazEF toxin-antitoxin module